MDPSTAFAAQLHAPVTLPPELRAIESDPLWAALLMSTQNVVLGEIWAARYPELADPSRRDFSWAFYLDRVASDANTRLGAEVLAPLTVATVDELWFEWMRTVARNTAGEAAASAGPGVDAEAASVVFAPSPADPESIAFSSPDEAVRSRVIALTDVLSDVVDKQLFDRFGVWPSDEHSPGRPEDPANVPAVQAPPTLPVWASGASPAHPAPYAYPTGTGHPAPPLYEGTTGAGPSTTAAAFPPSPYPTSNETLTPQSDAAWRALPPRAAQLVPASFGRRAGAWFIDRAFVVGVGAIGYLLVVLPAIFFTRELPDSSRGGITALAAMGGFLIVMIAYALFVIWLVGKKGKSPGKAIVGIEVTGFFAPGPIGFGRAFVREILRDLFTLGSIFTVWLPYASVFWDSSKKLRGWHDKAADDIVIVSPKP